MGGNYTVTVEVFAERHYIKSFAKKYHRAWDVTLRAIIAQFERVDALTQTDIAEIIVDLAPYKMLKSNFKIAGTRESAKSSGNRCIAIVNEDTRRVSIVLVYHHGDLGKGNETVLWKHMVTANYPEFAFLC